MLCHTAPHQCPGQSINRTKTALDTGFNIEVKSRPSVHDVIGCNLLNEAFEIRLFMRPDCNSGIPPLISGSNFHADNVQLRKHCEDLLCKRFIVIEQQNCPVQGCASVWW